MILFAFVLNWNQNNWASMSHQRLNRLNSDNQIESFYICFICGLWSAKSVNCIPDRDIVLCFIFLLCLRFSCSLFINITFIECWKITFQHFFLSPTRVSCTLPESSQWNWICWCYYHAPFHSREEKNIVFIFIPNQHYCNMKKCFKTIFSCVFKTKSRSCSSRVCKGRESIFSL